MSLATTQDIVTNRNYDYSWWLLLMQMFHFAIDDFAKLKALGTICYSYIIPVKDVPGLNHDVPRVYSAWGQSDGYMG